VVSTRLASKQSLLASAGQALADPNATPFNHRQILADTHNQLNDIDGLTDKAVAVSPNTTATSARPASGKTGPLTPQEAQTYLQQAGGDKNAARAAAKKDNRSF
jgi:hypothetical protein